MQRAKQAGSGSKQVGIARSLVKRTRANWRKIATAVAAVSAIGMGFHVVLGQNGLTAYQQKRLDSADLTAQTQKLSKENERMRGHVARLESDPDAIEHQAREELHYTRPGEVIYTLPTAPNSK